ncbi:MAG: hypothetical protein IT337_14915 [Thermomicrobiales bacterium]|nr:hypothetical protein [Thermomicrobiales bacterium]
MAQHNRDKKPNPNIDVAGEHGGDTGPSSVRGTGVQAEKGDWRRTRSADTGPTRRGSQGADAPHGKRNGSESNAS